MDHDPIEDIITNDEEDDGVGPAYNVYDYWFEEQYCVFESSMELLKREIYLDRINAPYEEAADVYYEELDYLEAIAGDAPRDPMASLQYSMKAAEIYDCHMDKSFAYEGLDIISQEIADDNYGDGDPSQWDY